MCWQTRGFQLANTALITGIVALLVIGALASAGVLNSSGITHTAYLSYGMYGGAALSTFAEVIILCRRANNKQPLLRQQIHTPQTPSESFSEPLNREEVDAIYLLVDEFVEKSPRHERTMLKSSILLVIENQAFQANPHDYVVRMQAGLGSSTNIEKQIYPFFHSLIFGS